MTKTDVYFDNLIKLHFTALDTSKGLGPAIAGVTRGIAKEAYYEGRKDERATKHDLIRRLMHVMEGPATINGAIANAFHEAEEYLRAMEPNPRVGLKLPDFRAEDIQVESSMDVERARTIIAVKHVPTGIVATCGDYDSTHKNKASALRALREKVETLWAGETTAPNKPNPCLDPDKMHGAGDRFGGSDYRNPGRGPSGREPWRK